MPTPPAPKKKHRSLRVEDELWEAAQAEAEERGETVAGAIRRFLLQYVKKKS